MVRETILNEGAVIVRRAPSVFVSRNNAALKLDDVVVQRRSSGSGAWGGRHANGARYVTVARFAAEDRSVLRSYEALPTGLAIGAIAALGFFDAVGGEG